MVRHAISHALPQDEAQKLIDRAFAHYLERYPKYEPTLHWQDPQHGEICVSIRGYKLHARVVLGPGETVVEMDVPMLLRPFQGTAVRTIEREAQRWLKPDQAT